MNELIEIDECANFGAGGILKRFGPPRNLGLALAAPAPTKVAVLIEDFLALSKSAFRDFEFPCFVSFELSLARAIPHEPL